MSSGRPTDTEAPAPARHGTIGRGRRPRTLWLAGGLVLVAVALAIVLLIGGGRPEVTAEQFGQVGFGDSKEEVAEKLGAEGESGSHTIEGQDATFEDCWYYAPTGPSEGTGDEVVVCFENEEVVSTTSPF